MSERDILIDCLRYRPVATTAAQMREASDLLERDGARIAELEAENERLLEANPSAAYALEYASLRIGLNSARAALAEAQEELRVCQQDAIRLQSALAEARESVAQWMLAHSFATGHGDTLDELLGELSWQVNELWAARDAARAEAEALRKDAERIDWLQHHATAARWGRGNAVVWECKEIRAAIDAAKERT